MTETEPTRQVRKTRNALLAAFRDLVLSKRYHDIRVADIIERADVGRSTFYDHFRNKDELLRASLVGVFDGIAGAVEDECDRTRLAWIVDHFRQNQRLTRGMLNGPSSPQVVGVLADLMRERLDKRCVPTDVTPSLSMELVAAHIAEAILGLIRAWLRDPDSCQNESLADAIATSASAMRRVLLRETS